jgi:O-antigen/teichoic acid export membrane protein
LTTLLASVLFVAGQLTLATALAVLGIATALVSFVIGHRLLPEPFGGSTLFTLPTYQVFRRNGGRLIRFGRWLWLSNILIMITGYFDVLLVGWWSAPAVVGFYGLGLNLIMKVDVVNASLYTVLLPAVSALADPVSLRLYVRRALIRSAAISFLLLPLVFIVPPFVAIFYGSAFEPAGMYFQAMFGLVIIDIFAWPFILLAFPYNQPKLLASADAVRAVTMLSLSIWLIPHYGPLGAVAGKFAAKIAGAVFALIALKCLQRTRALGQDPSRLA